MSFLGCLTCTDGRTQGQESSLAEPLQRRVFERVLSLAHLLLQPESLMRELAIGESSNKREEQVLLLLRSERQECSRLLPSKQESCLTWRRESSVRVLSCSLIRRASLHPKSESTFLDRSSLAPFSDERDTLASPMRESSFEDSLAHSSTRDESTDLLFSKKNTRSIIDENSLLLADEKRVLASSFDQR